MSSIDELKNRLERINDIVYSNTVILGSSEYFEIRNLATAHLNELKDFKIKINYFKSYGKFYSDAEIDITAKTYEKAIEQIESMFIEGVYPGLVDRAGDHYHITVHCDDGYPKLYHPKED